MKIRFYVFGFAASFLLIVGNIYPVLMWFEYDINMYKPRVSDYILNRLGWEMTIALLFKERFIINIDTFYFYNLIHLI